MISIYSIYSDTAPTLYSNAFFGEGNSSNSISNLGCAGWESHIGQCNIQEYGSCSHSDDAGLTCIGTCYDNRLWYGLERLVVINKICEVYVNSHIFGSMLTQKLYVCQMD